MGPIAGPMVACAVALHPGVTAQDLEGVDDSKKLSAKNRATMATAIAAKCSWSTAWATVEDIAEHGHNNAHQMAMADAGLGALEMTSLWPGWSRGKKILFVVDGNKIIHKILSAGHDLITLTKGDRRCLEVAAASIVAKYLRDEHMVKMAAWYPGYDFGNNKGYATKQHLKTLALLGPTPIHRRKATQTAMYNWKEKTGA